MSSLGETRHIHLTEVGTLASVGTHHYKRERALNSLGSSYPDNGQGATTLRHLAIVCKAGVGGKSSKHSSGSAKWGYYFMCLHLKCIYFFFLFALNLS